MLHALPGDPATVILGQRATEDNKKQFREAEGLNDPLPQQYGRFISGVSEGELGTSHYTGRPVVDELKERVPATIELTVFAMLFAVIVGISLGILASVKPRSIWDFICLAFALVGVSMPIFWLGFIVKKIFAGELGLFPFGERIDLSVWTTFESDTGFYLYDSLFIYQNPELFLHCLHHLMLPAMVLATVPMALIARMTRANMLEVLNQDFIRTARAKGLSPRPVITRHAMRNALIPVITAIGTQFGYLLGGAVLTETIFSWPGMGTYIIGAIDVLDGKPLQASILLVAVVFIVMNLLTDVSYAFIDPRLRHGGSKDESVQGVSWPKFLPWMAAGLPWLGLLVVSIADSTNRMPDDGLYPALRTTVFVLLGLELLLIIGWLIFTGILLDLIKSSGIVAKEASRHSFELLKDFLKFIRKHKPALFGLTVILTIIFVAVFASWIAPYEPMQGLEKYNEPASAEHLFGTDPQGRDLFSRMVFGARTTLLVALAATLLSLVLGTLVGSIAAFFGGAADTFLMRVVDFMMSFPSFLLAVVTVAVLGKDLNNLIWAVGIVGIPLYARQVRAEVLRIKALEFIEAARGLGFSQLRILFRAVIPNCLSPIIVLGTLGMGSAILDVAGLAFLGLGGDPFVPEWGLILKLGWDESSKGVFQVTIAGLAILITVLGFNLLGDGLRDWLDPRTRSK
ncbi:MAG: ABC transporter permease subunit [Planctomycetota bacterium]